MSCWREGGPSQAGLRPPRRQSIGFHTCRRGPVSDIPSFSRPLRTCLGPYFQKENRWRRAKEAVRSGRDWLRMSDFIPRGPGWEILDRRLDAPRHPDSFALQPRLGALLKLCRKELICPLSSGTTIMQKKITLWGWAPPDRSPERGQRENTTKERPGPEIPGPAFISSRIPLGQSERPKRKTG